MAAWCGSLGGVASARRVSGAAARWPAAPIPAAASAVLGGSRSKVRGSALQFRGALASKSGAPGPTGLAGFLLLGCLRRQRTVVAGAAAPDLVVVASVRGRRVTGRGGSRDLVASLEFDDFRVGLSRMGFVGCAGAGSWWLSIFGRNPMSGLCRIWRRRRPWASCSFLEALLLCGAPSPSPRPLLRRETSDLRDQAMKAPSRLRPPWGHRLGAGHNLETSGWRHLRRVVAASSPCGLLRRPFRGRCFLFGNDDGVERSFGRGSGFGSRIFPACPRCSFVGCLVALKSELRWSVSMR